MKHRTFFFLSIAALSLLLTVAAENTETVTVTDAYGFMSVFKSADEKSMEKNVVLANDIDFSGINNFVPFGVSSSGKCTPYRGKLQGNGHVLKGLTIDQSGNTLYPHAGLFCGLDGATIEDVVFDKSCKMTGSDSSALAVTVTGSATLLNVKSQSTVSGTGSIGGLFAHIESPIGSSIVFDNCVVEGSVSNTGKNTGGFVGHLNGNVTVSFKSCESGSTIESTDGMVGGFIGYTEKNQHMEVDVRDSMFRGIINARSSAKTDLFAGGIIGFVFECEYSSIIVNNVTITGTITTEKSLWSVYTGGFFGYLRSSHSNVVIKDSVSTAKLSVTFSGGYATYTGGFIGCINAVKSVNVQIFDCQSSSEISVSSQSDYVYTGGFLGYFAHSTDSAITMEHCTNDGAFTFSGSFNGEFYAGGLIAELYENTGCSLTLNKVTNKANAEVTTGSSYSCFGGLIGNSADAKTKFSLVVRNSANYGNIKCNGGKASGLYYTTDSLSTTITYIVHNSINKGTMTGNNVYGISNAGTLLNNVVSMGELSGSTCLHYPTSATSTSSYYLSSVCPSSTHGIPFTKDSDGLYYTTSENKRVDKALNEESTRVQYGMLWDTELNLFNALHVYFGLPVNRLAYVKPGDTFKMACDAINQQLDEYVTVNRNTWTVLVNETIIVGDLDVALCFNLTLNGVLDTTKQVEYETLFSNVNVLEPFLNERYAIIDSNDNTTMYDENTIMKEHMTIIVAKKMYVSIGRPMNKTLYMMNGTTLNDVANTLNTTFEGFVTIDRKTWTAIDNTTMIENDIDIALCHELTLNGMMNSTLMIEHGTSFSEIEVLEPFMNKSYAIVDANNKTTVYNLNTTVNEDMYVMIKKTGRVVIEIEGVEKSDVDVVEIIRVIEGATGGGVHVIDVDVVYDDDGKVTQVTVVVVGEESARDVVNAVEILDKGDGCGVGVLCRRGRVFVEGEKLDVSGSPLFFLSTTLFTFMMLFSFLH